METINKLSKIESQIKAINKEIKRYSKIQFKKEELQDQRRKLRNLEKRIKEQFVKVAYGIDLTSVSVVSLSAKKSRYLRNSEGYHNDLNLVCAYNPTTKKGYGVFVKESQIKATHLKLLFKLSNIKLAYTDNRHKGILTLSKKYTQMIERKFSSAKRPIYEILKPLQSWKKDKDGKTKIFTDMKREQLIQLYKLEFLKEGIEILNEPIN